MTIHLNFGSNIGDSRTLITRAIVRLLRLLPGATAWLSDFYESDSWGYVSENSFFNRAVLVNVSVDLPPLDVLAMTQAVEKEIGCGMPHRHADGSYCDRLIDIDIIDINGMKINTERLTLPHPRAHMRPFVMIPMAQTIASARNSAISNKFTR